MTNLKFLLQQQTMTQKEFSELMHLPESSISRYASQERIPKVTTAVRMAHVLGVQVEDLFDVEGWREFC